MSQPRRTGGRFGRKRDFDAVDADPDGADNTRSDSSGGSRVRADLVARSQAALVEFVRERLRHSSQWCDTHRPRGVEAAERLLALARLGVDLQVRVATATEADLREVQSECPVNCRPSARDSYRRHSRSFAGPEPELEREPVPARHNQQDLIQDLFVARA